MKDFDWVYFILIIFIDIVVVSFIFWRLYVDVLKYSDEEVKAASNVERREYFKL